jgi:hypothetical protein
MRWSKRSTARGKTPPTRRRQSARVWRVGAAVLLLFAVVLVIARLALPTYLEHYVNRVLDQSTEFDGRIGQVDVHLWRGAYSIHDVDIVKTTHSVPVPFFEARRVDFSLDWNALMHGGLRGKVVMDNPRLNFVHGPTDEESQTGANEPWLAIMDDLYPFRIDHTEINHGEIHFQAFHTDPPVDIYLSHVEAVITNLTNVRDEIDPLMASVTAHGSAMDPLMPDGAPGSRVATDDAGQARFEFKMDFDPNAYRPTFVLAARMLDLDVTALNELTLAYGKFDFESGTSDFVIELTARNGLIDGYAKPLFRDLVVIGARDFETNDPLRVFWEALVGVTQEVFQNQSRGQFGTRLAIEGDLNDPRVDLFEIVGNVLRNAFVRAYLPQYESPLPPELGADEDRVGLLD